MNNGKFPYLRYRHIVTSISLKKRRRGTYVDEIHKPSVPFLTLAIIYVQQHSA